MLLSRSLARTSSLGWAHRGTHLGMPPACNRTTQRKAHSQLHQIRAARKLHPGAISLHNQVVASRAGVAELADAQDLGSCGVTPVEVQVLSPAPPLFDKLTKPAKTRINTGDFLLHEKVRWGKVWHSVDRKMCQSVPEKWGRELVPGRGLEPPLLLGDMVLSHARLPVPPTRRVTILT